MPTCNRILTALALSLAPLAALCAPVDLAAPDLPEGVRYGVDQVRTVSQAPLFAVQGGDRLPAGLAGKGPEAFAITPRDGGFEVAANAHAGLMYGLLELRDRLKQNKPPTEPVISAPALRLRGDQVDFPFYLGVDLYEGRWRGAQKVENSPDNWWLDKGHWAWRLRRCAELRMNCLLICHPHPFMGLIDLPEFPEAAYLDPAQLKRCQEQFRWILDTADQWGVKLYFLLWNVWTSPGFAKAHNINMEGTDSPLVRQYTRACLKGLFETYPKVAGIVTIAGEAPPGCTDFVRDAIVGGLNELPQPPEFIFWTWCAYPEDVKPITEGYRGRLAVLHYLQYEQLFRPQADPRIKRTSEALGGTPVVALGGLGTTTGWNYWSDPYYIGGMMADLPRQNVDGCIFGGLDSFTWVSPKWLGWEGLARYWWQPPADNPDVAPGQPRVQREDDYWESRIAEHYGVPEVAEPFLRASIAASSVPTRMLALLHRQTDHHHAQFGLPLTHYLGLPTLTTYVFENHESIDELGRLAPRMGLTYPNPDWGEKVNGVVDFVAGATDGTNPPQIADELEASAREVLDCLTRLRLFGDRVKDGPEAWGRTLDQMEMNAHLGEHVAWKIRAAVAWERWRTGQADAAEVLPALQRSVEAFDQLTACAERIYPNMDISNWRSCLSRPWPWTNLQVWNLDQWRKHQWRDSAAMFHQELEWVRGELAQHYSQPLLPFEDDLQPFAADARVLLKWDFEGETPEGSRIAANPPDTEVTIAEGQAPGPLAGKRMIATNHTDDVFYFALTTDPAKLPLEIGKRYRVTADYQIIQSADYQGDWLSAGARTTEGGWRKDVGTRYMGGPAGTRGRLTITFMPQTWSDYFVYLSLHGKSTVELDNLEIRVEP